eukprot:GHVN01088456.1.p1 GENE.GHVN01088456.1~~GHVN01088456.1.p1  ORF type:complete len:177 (-),score=17.91 GHVN01088456.1:335-865(-)
MRPLTTEETKMFYFKLIQLIGNKAKQFSRENKIVYHRKCVYCVSVEVRKAAKNVPSKSLKYLGLLVGRFTKSGKFRVSITISSKLAKLVDTPLILYQKAEMNFCYGHDVVKGNIVNTEIEVKQNQGKIVVNDEGSVLGFGVLIKTTGNIESALPIEKIVLNQQDVGLYIRAEDSLF